MSELTFFGYRRENNRVGIRNHVVILPLDDLSNAACEAVANNIKGTLALPHHYGRLQFGEDLELHFRTLIGTGANPNVAAVVVIGIEPGWTARVVDGIAKTGKPVQGFAIEQHGDIETIASASRVAKDFLQAASEARREECPISDLWVSHKCGESDTTSGMGANPTVGNFIDKTDAIGVTNCFGETSEITGAEHLCRERAINKEVGDKWFATWEAYMNEVIEPNKTSDLSESQPTKGNIEGGLTTIEEKPWAIFKKLVRTLDISMSSRQPKPPIKEPAFTTWTPPRQPPSVSRSKPLAGLPSTSFQRDKEILSAIPLSLSSRSLLIQEPSGQWVNTLISTCLVYCDVK